MPAALGSYGQSSGSSVNRGSQFARNNAFSDAMSDSLSQSTSFQNSKAASDASSGARWTPEQLARINQLYPMLLANYQTANRAPDFAKLLRTIGGPGMEFSPLAAFPNITEGPIWTDPQIQARVNAMRALNESGAAGQTKRLAETTAARGFGTNSPLLQELTGNVNANLLATNTGAENDLRWNAASGNATHLLDTQKAGVGRSTAVNAAQIARETAMSEDDLRRRQMALVGRGQSLQYKAARQNALLQALGYYNQPLPFSQSKSSQSSQGGSVSSSQSKSRQRSGSSGVSGGNQFGSSSNQSSQMSFF